mgnify:CR=1 FL=1
MNKLGCVVFPTLVGFCEGGLKTTLTYFFTQTHGHETTIGLTEKLSEIRKALSLFAREPYLTAFTGNGISVMSDNNTRTSNTLSKKKIGDTTHGAQRKAEKRYSRQKH